MKSKRKVGVDYSVYKVIIPLTIVWSVFLWMIDFASPEQSLDLGLRCLLGHILLNEYLNYRKHRK